MLFHTVPSQHVRDGGGVKKAYCQVCEGSAAQSAFILGDHILRGLWSYALPWPS